MTFSSLEELKTSAMKLVQGTSEDLQNAIVDTLGGMEESKMIFYSSMDFYHKRKRAEQDQGSSTPTAAGTGREEAMALADREGDRSTKDVRVANKDPSSTFGTLPWNMVTVGQFVFIPRVDPSDIRTNSNADNMARSAVLEVWRVSNILPTGPDRTYVDMMRVIVFRDGILGGSVAETRRFQHRNSVMVPTTSMERTLLDALRGFSGAEPETGTLTPMRASRGTELSGGNRGNERGDRGDRRDPKRSRSRDRRNDQGPPRTRSRDRGSRNRHEGRDRNRDSPGERSRDDRTKDHAHMVEEERKLRNFWKDQEEKQRSRSGSQQGRKGSEEQGSSTGLEHYGPGDRNTVIQNPTPRNVPEGKREEGGKEGTGEGGLTPVLASPQEGEGKKKKKKDKKDKKVRVRNLCPDHDSEVDTSGTEDTEDANDRLQKENTKLRARVTYLEPREAKLSEEAIKELVSSWTKGLQQTISQKSQAERALQDKVRALRKEGDELREAKEKGTEENTRLRTERDEARADVERIRAERGAWREKADAASHETTTQKAIADGMERLTQELITRAVTAEVHLAERRGRNANADGTEGEIENSEGAGAVAIAREILLQREAEEALQGVRGQTTNHTE